MMTHSKVRNTRNVKGNVKAQKSIRINFTTVKFWGKPEELRAIIDHLQKESTTLMSKILAERPKSEAMYKMQDQMMNLQVDLLTARTEYALAYKLPIPEMTIEECKQIFQHVI